MRRLFRFPQFKKAKEIFTYISHNGEVGTDFLIKKIIGKKKVVVPAVRGKRMHLHELENAKDFKVGCFGIREPKNCPRKAKIDSIDIVIVPGIAFDKTGHRIGFGGGYFDRFLKKLRSTTIGLAYEFQIIDKVPAHKYDVPVDFIITEERIIKCNS